ncbi:hypothetical protein ATANTOWER_003604 [Ataeniobius toweri]|uniref:Secreted protein n=1 Tax=Ataeniobius toweri TaxID=208326 RepID=A0ABU7C5L5_9TELE|nr:hypothetical protein [Ataeniobius toweri]
MGAAVPISGGAALWLIHVHLLSALHHLFPWCLCFPFLSAPCCGDGEMKPPEAHRFPSNCSTLEPGIKMLHLLYCAIKWTIHVLLLSHGFDLQAVMCPLCFKKTYFALGCTLSLGIKLRATFKIVWSFISLHSVGKRYQSINKLMC